MNIQNMDARQDLTDAEIEAGAIGLMEANTNFANGVDHTREDVKGVWAALSGMERENFRRQAKAVLAAARQATTKE